MILTPLAQTGVGRLRLINNAHLIINQDPVLLGRVFLLLFHFRHLIFALVLLIICGYFLGVLIFFLKAGFNVQVEIIGPGSLCFTAYFIEGYVFYTGVL